MQSDDMGRRLVALGSRSNAFAILNAAERGPITRADAAAANSSKPETADLVLKELLAEGLLALGPRNGRTISYVLAPPGTRVLRLIRRMGAVAPPQTDGWWVTVKRAPEAVLPELVGALSASRPSRIYRCVGDFDLVAVIPDRDGALLIDDLMARLRQAGAREVAAARDDGGMRASRAR